MPEVSKLIHGKIGRFSSSKENNRKNYYILVKNKIFTYLKSIFIIRKKKIRQRFIAQNFSKYYVQLFNTAGKQNVIDN